MKQKKLLKQVAEYFAKKCHVPAEQIKFNTNLKDDLDLDSLDKYEVVHDLENQYKIQITEEEQDKMITIEDVINCLNSKL